LLLQAMSDKLDLLTFLDLDWAVVNRVLDREKANRRSGPVAEGVLRDLGTVHTRLS
jgi:pyruvate ferredoxin oxidoreductase alpha subunit